MTKETTAENAAKEPAGQDPAGAGAQAEQAKPLQAAHDDQVGRLNGLAEGLGSLGYEVPAEAEVTSHALAAISSLKAENEKLTKDLAAAKKKAAEAKPSTAKGRKVGPLKEDDQVKARDDGEGGTVSALEVLLERIRDAELVEVAFSDGRKEIEGVPALTISGEDAWRQTVAGLKLNIDPITVHGLASAFELRGYGLLLDGKLAAYRETGPHRILPGGQHNLANDVVFTG